MPIHSTPLPSGQNLRSVSAAHDILGETPLWCDRTATLFWLDIDGKKLQRLDPASGHLDVFTFDCGYAGSLALTEDPATVLIGLDLGLYLFNWQRRQLRQLCQVEPASLDNRLNDGRCDAVGRFWVGTMDNQLSRPHGAFYRVDPSGQVHRIHGDVIVANSIGFSPANDRVYFPTRDDSRLGNTGSIWRLARSGREKCFRTTPPPARARMGCAWTPRAMSGTPCLPKAVSCASRPKARSIGPSPCRSRTPPAFAWAGPS